MIHEIRLFARARDLVGAEAVRVEVPDSQTVGELRRRLASEWPALAGLLQRSAIAVDGEFAGDGLLLSAAAEIAVLPPVSGG